MTDKQAILLGFIEDENRSNQDGYGSFYPRNHYKIKSAIPSAPRYLDEDQRLTLYRYFIRRANAVPKIAKKDFPLLSKAYAAEKPVKWKRIYFTYLFGFNETGDLPSGRVEEYSEFIRRGKTMTQCDKYIRLPAQREKIAKFAPFAETDAALLLETLQHIGYIYSLPKEQNTYSAIDLGLWSAVLIILLHPDYAVTVFSDIYNATDLPDKAQHNRALGQTAKAVTAYAPNTALEKANAPLLEAYAAERAASEGVMLAHSLNLPLADDEDWRILIRLPHQNTSIHGDNIIILDIQDDPDHAWSLSVKAPHGRYSQWDKGLRAQDRNSVTQNDLDLPPLKTLAEFPAWAKTAAQSLNMSIAPETADIYVGRKRGAIALLKAWIFD